MAFEVLDRGSGQYRFLHGRVPLFALSPNYRTLTCALGVDRDTGWWRILLDSVLFTVSLLRGNEALACRRGGHAHWRRGLVSGSGGGKSTLLHQL